MPKLRNSVPKLRKHRASGRAVVTIAGKDYYLGHYGTKAAEHAYDAKIAEWLASGRSPSFGLAADQLTIAQLLAAYFVHAQSYYRMHVNSTYNEIFRAGSRLKELYVDTPVCEFGPVQFKAIRHKLVEEKLARVYINKTMAHILKIFKWGVSEDMVPAEVYQRLKSIEGLRKGFTEAPETDAVRPVDDAVVKATLKHLPPVVKSMVQLHMLIGCRPSELCSIKAGMVDRTGDVWCVRLTEHKNAHRDKERVLYLGPKAQAIIKPYLLRGADEYIFGPRESERKRREKTHAERTTPLNCGNRPGYSQRTRAGTRRRARTPKDCYDRSSYARAIARACQAAGVEQWSPNQIRHAVATNIRKQFGLEAAACTLGHAELNTTQIYAEQDRERALEVARRIG